MIQFQNRLKKLNSNQRMAVEHTEGPVMVVAGPGTGKTETLGARITHILATHGGDISGGNILCLTYTDAGTVAMRKRLLSFLGPEAHHIAIHTFHSFANMVLQENTDIFGIESTENISEIEQFELIESILSTLPASDPHFQKVGYSHSRFLLSFFGICKQEHWTAEMITEACQHHLDSLSEQEEFLYKRKTTDKTTGEVFQKGDLNQKKAEKEQQKIKKLISASNLFSQYTQKMKELGKYDFSDMILWVIDAFKTDEGLLSEYQERYLYILVDEFQDTNGAQKEMLDLLTRFWEDPNIFVVGDDDQSIYRFQGANMRNIMNFHHQYKKNIATITLDKNYRSSQNILNFANQIISKNTERLVSEIPNINKTLTAMTFPSDKAVSLCGYHNSLHEDIGIVKKIQDLHMNGVAFTDIAVLYKNHAQSQRLMKLCEQNNIPVSIKKTEDILDLPLIQQILTLIQYFSAETKQPFSGEPFLFSCFFHPWSGFKSTDIAHIALERKYHPEKKYTKEILLEHISTLENKKEKLTTKDKFITSLDSLETLFSQIPFVLFLEQLWQRLGIMEWVLNQPEKGMLLSALSTFFHFVQTECKKNTTFGAENLFLLLQKMKIYSISLPLHKLQNEGKGVNFITAHSSKGLEFEYVFVKGVTKQAWDTKRPDRYVPPAPLVPQNTGDHFEEIRRLFFVACTRAKQFLEISYPLHKESGEELQPSLLISESQESISPIHMQYNNEEIEQGIVQSLLPLQDHTDTIETDFLDTILEQYILSPTHLNKYLQCPKAFYYESLLYIPQAMNAHAVFGNSVHKGLEVALIHLKNNPSSSIQDLQHTAIYSAKKVLMDAQFSLQNDEYQKLEKQLEKTFASYFTTQFVLPEDIGKCKTEYSITTALEYQQTVIPLKGKLDKIEEKTGNRLLVTDYKTGNPYSSFTKKKLLPPCEENQFMGGEYWRQMMFYAVLIQQNPRGKQYMESGIFDFVEPYQSQPGKSFSVPITPEGVERIQEIIASVYASIRSGNFTGCGEESCPWCNK